MLNPKVFKRDFKKVNKTILLKCKNHIKSYKTVGKEPAPETNVGFVQRKTLL